MRKLTRTRASDPALARLEKRLGHHFRDPELLDLALRHRSYGHEAGSPERNNETLEFLGDAVLGFVVGWKLYDSAPPRAKVGDLSRRRAQLVSEASLAPRARALKIGEALRLGRGEEGSGGRGKDSILADALEALVAAIYLDSGMDAAREFILRTFEGEIAVGAAPSADPKTELQEGLQAKGLPAPTYRVVKESGAAHSRTFEVEVLAGEEVLATGEGRSKKAAGSEAARKALKRLSSVREKGRS